MPRNAPRKFRNGITKRFIQQIRGVRIPSSPPVAKMTKTRIVARNGLAMRVFSRFVRADFRMRKQNFERKNRALSQDMTRNMTRHMNFQVLSYKKNRTTNIAAFCKYFTNMKNL